MSGDRDRAAPPRAGWFWLCHVSCHQSGLCLEEEEGARGRIRHRRGAVPVFGCRGQGFKAAATPAPQARVRSGVCTETVRGQSRDRGLVLRHRCLGSAAGPGSPGICSCRAVCARCPALRVLPARGLRPRDAACHCRTRLSARPPWQCRAQRHGQEHWGRQGAAGGWTGGWMDGRMDGRVGRSPALFGFVLKLKRKRGDSAI